MPIARRSVRTAIGMEALARNLLHIPAPHIPANASDGRKMMGRKMKAGGLAFRRLMESGKIRCPEVCGLRIAATYEPTFAHQPCSFSNTPQAVPDRRILLSVVNLRQSNYGFLDFVDFG